MLTVADPGEPRGHAPLKLITPYKKAMVTTKWTNFHLIGASRS